MNTERTQKAGFTLIELLVVIAIVGVLSGVVLQSLNSARAKARDAQRLTEIDQINKALELAATGGTNALPSTEGNYYCLGDTTLAACGFNISATLNTLVQNNLANKKIPLDPKFASGSGVGVAYLYNSKVTPGTTPISTEGAYLSWVMENSTCGRGVKSSGTVPPNVPNGVQCFLRIGNTF